MNVDTQLQYALPTATPTRSVHDQPDQASARPVERPHHDEAADNQTRKPGARAELQHESHHPARQPQERQPAEQPVQTRQSPGGSGSPGELLDVIV